MSIKVFHKHTKWIKNIIITLIIICCLFLFNCYFFLFINIEQFINKQKQNITIEVFLSPGISEKDCTKIYHKINNYPLVKKIKFIPKEEAFKELIKIKGVKESIELLNINPCPNFLIIYLEKEFFHLEVIKQIIAELKYFNEIDEIIYPEEFLIKFCGFLKNIEKSKLVLGIILGIINLIILSGTFYLNFFSEKKLSFFIYTIVLEIIACVLSFFFLYLLYILLLTLNLINFSLIFFSFKEILFYALINFSICIISSILVLGKKVEKL